MPSVSCTLVILSFCPRHSTETALTALVNDLHQESNRGKSALLILFDLSASFDTVDLEMLIKHLHDQVGIHRAALNLEVYQYISPYRNCTDKR